MKIVNLILTFKNYYVVLCNRKLLCNRNLPDVKIFLEKKMHKTIFIKKSPIFSFFLFIHLYVSYAIDFFRKFLHLNLKNYVKLC